MPSDLAVVEHGTQTEVKLDFAVLLPQGQGPVVGQFYSIYTEWLIVGGEIFIGLFAFVYEVASEDQ